MSANDSRKRRWSCSCLAFVLVVFLSTASLADIYSGTLSSGTGLTGSGGWASDATLTWTVDNETNPGLWHYEYTLTVASKEISHIIIETSESFLSGNLFNLASDPESWAKLDKIGLNDPDEGNEGLPGSIYGIKIEAASDETSATVSFDSDRVPVWGDFYAKDGLNKTTHEWTYLYNSCFSDPDPVAAAANGSLNNHLLVPDTVTVPIPGAVVLGSLGLGFAGWLRRRQMTV